MTSLHDPNQERALYRFLGIALPPVGAYRYGAAAYSCAAPIAIVWATALISIAYGLLAGLTDLSGYRGFPLAIGLFLWMFATVWAFLVIRSIRADAASTDPQVHERRVRQKLDDHDPLEPLNSREDAR